MIAFIKQVKNILLIFKKRMAEWFKVFVLKTNVENLPRVQISRSFYFKLILLSFKFHYEKYTKTNMQ